jgi:hypothetical protein
MDRIAMLECRNASMHEWKKELNDKLLRFVKEPETRNFEH